jgi:hypothetical protein
VRMGGVDSDLVHAGAFRTIFFIHYIVTHVNQYRDLVILVFS